MSTFSDLVTAAALAAGTTDTFAAVGTIELRPEKGTIIGAWVNATADTNTAAEAYQTQFRFDFGEVGLKELLLTGPCSVGEGIATQSGGFAGPALLHPLDIPFEGNESIGVTAAHHGPAPTAGMDAMGGLLYVVGKDVPPIQWWRAFPKLMGDSGGDSEAAAAVTADNTAITALRVPSFAKHVCGYGGAAAQDAAPRTAEDLVLGIDFSQSSFPDWSPQKYPILWKYPNLSGTLVGRGISLPVMTWPAWIPTNSVSGTITPRTILVTGVTDAHSVTADIFYTKR